ncbi:MAG: glycoside hydrolase family 3 N-terminal domain-containing protein [archaeon]
MKKVLLILIITLFCLNIIYAKEIDKYTVENLQKSPISKTFCDKITNNSNYKYNQAIEKASIKFENYILSRTNRIPQKVLWGPNFDGAFFYRFGPGADMMGQDLKELSAEREKVKDLLKATNKYNINKQKISSNYSFGIPRFETLSLDELLLTDMLNLNSRSKSGKQMVIKHFPGGNEVVELTESQRIIFDYNLSEMKKTYLKPFIVAIKSKTPPVGIMVSHVNFPVMEKELRLLHPEIKEMPEVVKFRKSNKDFIYPASFSPYIIRGLLIKDLKYDGLVYADWYRMWHRSVFEEVKPIYSNYLNQIDPDNEDYMDESTFGFILATYAGVDSIYTMRPKINEIADYIKKNPEYDKVLNELVFRKLVAIGKRNEQYKNNFTYRNNLNKEYLYLTNNLELKIQFLVEELQFYYPISDQVLVKKLNEDFTSQGDIWNRKGLLLLVYRKYIVEELNNKIYPELGLGETAEYNWIYELSKTDFFEQYSKIKWPTNELDYSNEISKAYCYKLKQSGYNMIN